MKMKTKTKIKNINNKTLKVCSKNPLTGFNRDGYCRESTRDYGNHLVCAKVDKRFLDYTAKKGNDLSSVVKPGDKWCLCQDRYYEAYRAKRHPQVIESASSIKIKPYIKKIIFQSKHDKKGGNNKSRKSKSRNNFLYNPDDPKRSFDVYIDKNPDDTITIKYKTIDDIKNTIKKLERLYKTKKYSHKRIWQVGMIMKVRMEAMLKHQKTRYKNAKNVKQRYNLSNKYYKFLGKRTKAKTFKERKKMIFSI